MYQALHLLSLASQVGVALLQQQLSLLMCNSNQLEYRHYQEPIEEIADEVP